MLAVRARHAAELLDMSAAEFQRLVAAGAIPPPIHPRLGQHDRWRVSDLEAVLDGAAAKPNEDFEL